MHKKNLLPIILLVTGFMFLPITVWAAEICLQDDIGEKIHLKVHPNGQLVGYSEFNGVITGTAFGSYKRISDHEVMLGGDVNNDCSFGLHPGKFNARIDIENMTGSANGFLFICDVGTVVPFTSGIYPCGNSKGKSANWGAFFEKGN